MSKPFCGKLIIFTAPSGAGKTTIVKHVLKQITDLSFSVSACTRNPRDNETDGIDYYFLSLETFKEKIEKGEFLEWETFYQGQYYGTLKKEVERLWALQKHVIFDIDVKGAVNLKNKFGDKALTIFVKPPSESVLIERLTNRGTENSQTLNERISRAKMELKFEDKFDITLLNENLEEAKSNAVQIVQNFIQ
jgi:guanylate kinase